MCRIANVDPDPTGFRLALGENGNRRVVAVQPLGGENVSLDQPVQRPQRRRASANLIGERRQLRSIPSQA